MNAPPNTGFNGNNASSSSSSIGSPSSLLGRARGSGLTDFLNSGSLIARIYFLLLTILIFIIVLQLSIQVLSWFFSPSTSPHLITGMVDAKQMLIIPQDPNLMQGTLKYNIDPLNKYSEQEIAEVMKLIGFWYICEKDEKRLSLPISENGNNLSVGEKQLVCITRAILRVFIY